MAKREDLIAKYYNRLVFRDDLIQPRLIDLDPEKVVLRLRKEYYNYILLEDISVIIRAITSPSYSNLPSNKRIREWLKFLTPIGVNSSEGYAMRSSLGNITSIFILKSPRQDVSSEPIHELFVGLYGTNKMRASLPNFSYVLGGFNCTSPIIPSPDLVSSQVIESYCQNSSSTQLPYIVYENIAPAESLYQYCRSCTGEEFLVILTQIILALRQAWLAIGFVHNDLHYDNILIRQVPETISIPYSTPDGIKYITTNRIATLIDFGRSHILYQGRHYGYNFTRIGLVEGHPFPIVDVYKVLYSSLSSMVDSGNWSAFNKVKSLMSYFEPVPTQERAIAFFNRVKQSYFDYFDRTDPDLFKKFLTGARGSYPKRWLEAKSFNYDDFYDFITNLFNNQILTDQPQGQVGTCYDQDCGNHLEILASFFRHPLNILPQPEQFIDFYDLYTNQRGTPAFRSRVKKIFDRLYDQAKAEYITTTQGYLDYLVTTLDRLGPPITIIGKNITTLTSLAKSYRDQFTLLANLSANWDNFVFYCKFGYDIGKIYRDDDLINKINRMITSSRIPQNKLSRYIGKLSSDRQYILTNYSNYPSQDPGLRWLLRDLPNLANIILLQKR